MSERERTPAVVGVAIIRPHVMRLLFDDGVVRDLQYVPSEGRGSLLVPLEDPAYFAQVRVDDEARTVVWPNGLDLAPEVLHSDHEPDRGLGFPKSRRPDSPSDSRHRAEPTTRLIAGCRPLPLLYG